MNIHSFSTNIAKECGIIGAVLLQNFYFWHLKNKGNKKHFYDGHYWTYNSISGFREMFDYLTDKQIRYNVEKLVKGGYIKKGNYNKKKYDRTSWYALTNKSLAMFVRPNLQKRQDHKTKKANGYNKSGEPIPYTDTLNDTEKVKKVFKYQKRDYLHTNNKQDFKQPDFNKFLKDL